MAKKYEDCLLTDLDVAQELGDPLITQAVEVSYRPRIAGRESTLRCIGCQEHVRSYKFPTQPLGMWAPQENS